MGWFITFSKHTIQFSLVVGVFLGFFISDAILRRVMYYIPPDRSKVREQLMTSLPEFIQNYIKHMERIEGLKEKAKKAKSPEEKVAALYELDGEWGSREQHKKLMKEIVRTAPNSPKIALAWRNLLQDADANQSLKTYLEYIENCDIRTLSDKIHVWRIGLELMQQKENEMYYQFLKAMLAHRVISSDLGKYYERLWSEAGARGEKEIAQEAKKFQDICFSLLFQEQKERR